MIDWSTACDLTVCVFYNFFFLFFLQPSLGIAPKRALAIETAEQQAAMKKIKEMQSNRGELIKKEQENFKVFNQKVQAKNAAIVAANPEAATSGSVIASDRLMKELRTIHKSVSSKWRLSCKNSFLLKFSFSEKATKIIAICLMVLTFT